PPQFHLQPRSPAAATEATTATTTPASPSTPIPTPPPSSNNVPGQTSRILLRQSRPQRPRALRPARRHERCLWSRRLVLWQQAHQHHERGRGGRRAHAGPVAGRGEGQLQVSASFFSLLL